MGTLRYVKTPAELQEAAENNLEFFDATMQAVKVFYKTTPGLSLIHISEPTRRS